VTWAPPASDGGSALTGYRVIDTIHTAVGASTRIRTVAATATSAALDTTFGLHGVQVFAVNAAGATAASAPGLEVAKPPTSVTYRESTVGDGRIAITFGWPGPITTVTTGGASMTPVVRVSETAGGTTIEVAPGTSATFEGLRNGQSYTFDAVAVNACGASAGAGGSPVLSPVPPPVAATASPVIVDPHPALRARTGRAYAATFVATGSPAPTFSLRGAPSWLTIDAITGRVHGVVPRRTDEFHFAVVASNGIGAEAVAGPFEVVLRTPVRPSSRR
jgi:Putative Ig domain